MLGSGESHVRHKDGAVPFPSSFSVPEKIKARTDTQGEASLRGHLKAEGAERTASQAVSPKLDDRSQQLH